MAITKETKISATLGVLLAAVIALVGFVWRANSAYSDVTYRLQTAEAKLESGEDCDAKQDEKIEALQGIIIRVDTKLETMIELLKSQKRGR